MSGIVVAVYLTNSTTNKQIWSETHRYGAKTGQISTFQEEVAYSIAVKTSGAHSVIAKTLSRQSRTIPPADLGAYEAILRFYEYANPGIIGARYSSSITII
jgi:hypothetical protein